MPMLSSLTLLSELGKLLEHIIKNKLLEIKTEDDLYTNKQYGFQRKCSMIDVIKLMNIEQR